MLEKLQIVKQRFDEVSDLIIQPDIITNQKRYVALNKEYKDLRLLMDKRELYIELTDNLAEAEDIISNSSDPEMIEMAKMQYDEAKEGIPKLDDDIRVLLIPKDPEDSKNAVVELRAGAGGDEASIRNTVKVEVGK
jgi:peptide chain release factor 1